MLIRANAAAETELLKAQVHPHFLFNTLNNIYSFTLDRSPKAEELISHLSDIMKYMVNDCNVALIALEKEIRMARDYIELEKVRYGNRLDIQIEITGNYKNKMIAPLLIIPFIENSFKHGVSKILKDPWIKLFIQADETVLHFSLSNNKPTPALKKDGKNGVGLANARKRLQLLYPGQHLLSVEETNSTYSINMQVPLEKIKEPIRQAEEVYQ
jgi:LytS/YehU family sensor histidine kinase